MVTIKKYMKNRGAYDCTIPIFVFEIVDEINELFFKKYFKKWRTSDFIVKSNIGILDYKGDKYMPELTMTNNAICFMNTAILKGESDGYYNYSFKKLHRDEFSNIILNFINNYLSLIDSRMRLILCNNKFLFKK